MREDGAESQARARPGEALCAKGELKCCFLGNKKSQMLEEGCYVTQYVFQCEGTGKRKGQVLRLLQNHPDNS